MFFPPKRRFNETKPIILIKNLADSDAFNFFLSHVVPFLYHPQPRPKSTNLVKIDTDVTITGVYVNTVSSQETICKTLKYRTAYSVTEECVVSRPPTQEPPKSYTPLSALTNMRPPGGQIPPESCKCFQAFFVLFP